MVRSKTTRQRQAGTWADSGPGENPERPGHHVPCCADDAVGSAPRFR